MTGLRSLQLTVPGVTTYVAFVNDEQPDEAYYLFVYDDNGSVRAEVYASDGAPF